jgi:hypothetical protein
MKLPWVPLSLGFFCGVVLAVRGDTVSLTPSADTSLFQASPDNNLGRTLLAVGAIAGGQDARALLRYDLAASLPAGATVTSVTLDFNVVRSPPAAANSIFSLRPLLRPWNEGTGVGLTGSFAQPGETTWNSQFHGTTPWSTPGGTAGIDFSAASSGTVDMEGLGAYTFGSTPAMVADVQRWASDPANNFGWIMISLDEDTPSTARRIASREDGLSAPRLTIEFVPVPEPNLVALVVVGLAAVFSLRQLRNRT